MSDRKRCCCNCRHCERVKEIEGNCEVIKIYCNLDNHYVGYEYFVSWCKRWAKETEET